MARGWLVGAALTLLVGGCADALVLSVDLRTDFVAGTEFSRVRTEIIRASEMPGGLETSQSAQLAVALGQQFVAGRRVAEFDLTSGGTFLVRVALLDLDGTVVATRDVRTTVKSSFGLTVLITRSCAGVVCPRPDGDASATTCLGGRCVPPECSPRDPEACGAVECSADAECGARVACARGTCVEGFCLQVPVEGACAPGEWCSVERGCLALPGDGGGECIPEAEACNGIDDDCDRSVDEDFDLASDPAHCGACGVVCGASHATPTCAGGACALSCDEGWADCDASAADGCESDLASPASCGACGTTCAAPTPLCVLAGGSASCASSCPASAPTLCAASCVDTDTSLAHCGGCGAGCDPAHATGACAAGRCGVASCDPGWADCDSDPADGCESDLSTTASCGACGRACAGATPYCARSGTSHACTDGCSDGVRGGDETDVDCGGPLCAACAVGLSCSMDRDCDGTLRCTAGRCAPCGECMPGATEMTSCGMCGSRSRTCQASCSWGSWGACGSEGSCTPGAMETRACGNCGMQSRICDASCGWGAWSTCGGEGGCAAGTSETTACGLCGTMSRSCSATCAWGAFGACTGEGVCSPGTTQPQSCGNCGTQTRTCSASCGWGAFGTCGGQGPCAPGAVESQACGDCGTQSRTCTSSCTWNPYGSCGGEGACSPGSTTSTGCYNSCQRRTCSGTCSFPAAPDGCTGCGCAAFTQCGLTCPANFHAVSYSRSFSCGSGTTDNQARCEADCGSAYTKCGLSCSTGYHAVSYSRSFSCGSGTTDNQARCELNGSACFTQCGLSCPSGYHSTSFSRSFSCGSGTSNNQARCCPD